MIPQDNKYSVNRENNERKFQDVSNMNIPTNHKEPFLNNKTIPCFINPD